jgi:dihydroorotate dehydrogenase (fumarate)
MTVDMTTRYLGLELRSPLVASASPMGQKIDTLRRLQDAGVGAVVLPSLFEEQVEHEELQLHGVMDLVADSHPEALTYLPELEDYNTGTDAYLRHLAACVAELEVPVIGSLNGISVGGWLAHAKRLQDAGAAALELNVYFIAADPDETSDAVEQRYIDLVEAVRAEIHIPLAVKIGPLFSSIGHMAHRLAAAGADGLVLFNRFMQPDIDLETMTIDPTLHLSRPEELLLPLRWIGILRDKVHASLALSTGCHSAADAVKGLLVGADVVMMASALLHMGPEHMRTVADGVETWMSDHDYTSVSVLRGAMSMAHVPDPVAYARANYARLVSNYVSPYDWRMTDSGSLA